jgi:glyoxylase-like metal-dependent hydrolase (beta-lactamase superfamily II)
MSNGSRRHFLHALGGGGLIAAGFGATARTARAQPRIDRALAVTELRDGLLQVTGAGCNVVVASGPEGLLLVDSGSSERAADLKKLLSARFAGARVAVLFNTHWHLEHTGGNDLLIEPGSTVVAHENTRLWMSTKFYVDWQDRRYAARPPNARPNKTFFSSDPQPLELTFGGEKVVYGHLLEAQTDGDIYVHFPQRNVIAAGGAVTAGAYPTLDYVTGGWIGGLMNATQKLIDMADADTLIVPQSGAVRSRSDLEAQHQMLATVRERVEAMALKGHGIDEMIDAGLTKEFDARFGPDARQFITNTYQGLWWNRMRAI